MIFRFILVLAFSIIFMHGFTAGTPAYAQDTNNRSALDDIFNPKDPNADNTPKTPASMANEYYKSCVAQESLAFNDYEKDLLCGCTSAKMTEFLEVDDYKHLHSSTMKGRDIRSQYMAYAYAPCLQYPMESKVADDCKYSPKLADIRFGKDQICQCTVETFQIFFQKYAADIFKQAQVYHPRTLNPLEYYTTETNAYHSRLNTFIGECVNKRGTHQTLKAKREKKPISGY